MATTEGAVEDAVRAIRAMDREFMENVAAKSASRIAAVYADDARILMPGQPVIAGRSEILAFYQAALAGPVQAITLDTTQIEVSGDLAYAFGNNTVMLQPAGEAAREVKGKYVVVYRRQTADDWKIVVDSYSNDG
ncbi:MAG: SgcJ/EcaC family oxidoreductase [Bryobacterales bacterium]|nr:SgcJ/EcaC family oxidoreductase [Bryobacterales bacterium]